MLPGMMEGEQFGSEVAFKRDVGGVDVVLEREELESLRRLDQPGWVDGRPIGWTWS